MAVDTETSCWACGRPGLRPTTRLEPLPFLGCPACGFEQRIAGPAAMRTHYEEDAYGQDRRGDYVRAAASRRHDAQVRVKHLRRLGLSGRLLDVGTADGAFVAAAGADGFDAAGLEPTPTFASHALAAGLHVRQTTLEDAHLPAGELDVVTLWHVLEHVESPTDALRLVHAALRPGGALVVEVPNAGSAMARGMGTAWPMLEPDVHVGQYTGTALRRLLERCGFAVGRVEALSSLPYAGVRTRYAPGAIAHRVKWRGGEGELLRAVAAAP